MPAQKDFQKEVWKILMNDQQQGVLKQVGDIGEYCKKLGDNQNLIHDMCHSDFSRCSDFLNQINDKINQDNDTVSTKINEINVLAQEQFQWNLGAIDAVNTLASRVNGVIGNDSTANLAQRMNQQEMASSQNTASILNNQELVSNEIVMIKSKQDN